MNAMTAAQYYVGGDMAKVFCKIDSNGIQSNLQLFTLTVATEQWRMLLLDLENEMEDDFLMLTERLSFISHALAVSLIQLAGQNIAKPYRNSTPFPFELVRDHLTRIKTPEPERAGLLAAFKELVKDYDSFHHFGLVETDRHHDQIASITPERVQNHIDLTTRIWNLTVFWFRSRGEGDLESISPIEHADHLEGLAFRYRG
ncbi:hypothetical protein [Wenzhouxiangella sp. EGI_FJ10409]|uniref:hypothetical protein n=1 Tax=Wenzhouxiangella sp. EGI_FJ10409 TaxID=3243767 RepID=UPI0035E1EEC6